MGRIYYCLSMMVSQTQAKGYERFHLAWRPFTRPIFPIATAAGFLSAFGAGGPFKPGFGLSGNVQTSQTWANEQTRLSSCRGD